MLQIFQAQKNFPGAVGAQVASSNQVLTSVGWGVQKGGEGGEGGGGCQASQVSPPTVDETRGEERRGEERRGEERRGEERRGDETILESTRRD